jgi:hypothetical protein
MRGISKEHVHVIDFASKIVTVGLGLLWISGIGFLIHYGLFDPAKLQNPKIWAKIAIVAVLSINGVLVHYFVLPRIRSQIGQRLLDGLSHFHCSLLLLAGTVSAISWYVPLMLGAIPQLNFVVPAEVILVGYALLLIAINTVIQGAIAFFLRGYSIPVVSDRSKRNIVRGSFALALALICASFFMTRATDYGDAFADSAKRELTGESKAASASRRVDLVPASSRSDKDANRSRFEQEQSHMGALGESAVTAVWQNDGKVIERTVISSAGAAELELLDFTEGADGSVARDRKTAPRPLKDAKQRPKS